MDFKKIRAIIIHQTDSSNASGTMSWWKESPFGAHLIVDRGVGIILQTKNVGTKSKPNYQYTKKTPSYNGNDGKIYQTAHLNKRCNHAGKLRDKNYPNNYDSIGIEFVSKYDEVKKLYPPPSVGQIQSGAWLVKTLVELITTIPSIEATYAHGVIAYKTSDMSEGGSTLDEIKDELKPKQEKPLEIKIESSCTEIIQMLYPVICNSSGGLPSKNIPLNKDF